MAQMYACGLSKAKLLEDWEETANKSWGGTHPNFTRKFNKERHKIEREKSHKNYEICAVFYEAPYTQTLKISQVRETSTTTDIIFTS